jgi:hypothetical protein
MLALREFADGAIALFRTAHDENVTSIAGSRTGHRPRRSIPDTARVKVKCVAEIVNNGKR